MELVLPDSFINGRRLAYRCCAANWAYKAQMDRQRGKVDCYEEKLTKAYWAHWGEQVMLRTALSTEDATVKCSTHAVACQVAQKIDPLCISCGCGCTEPAAPVVDCTVVANYNVLGLGQQDVTSLPLSPSVGDQYLVTTDNSIYILASIYEWDGTQWVITVISDGSIIFDEFGDQILVYAGFAGTLYPTISVVFTGTDNQYSVTSSDASLTPFTGRSIIIEATNASSVYRVATIPESNLVGGDLLNTGGTPFTPTGFRVTYQLGSCQYGPFDAIFYNTTPFNSIVLGTGGTTNAEIYQGQIQDAQPFTSVDARPIPPAGLVRRISTNNNTGGLSGPYVAVGSGGIFRASADGVTWATPGGNWPTSPWLALVTEANQSFNTAYWITYNTWLVAGGPFLLFLSVDNAATFSYVNITDIVLGVDEITCAVAYNTTEFVVGTRAGVWITSNAGASWTKTWDSEEVTGTQQECTQIVRMGNDVLVAFFEGGIVRSTDRGVTWGAQNTSVISADAVGNYYWLSFSAGSRIWTSMGHRSSDAGATWTQPPAGFTGGRTICHMNDKVFLYAGMTGLDGAYISFDSGATNSIFYPNAPSDEPIWAICGKYYSL